MKKIIKLALVKFIRPYLLSYPDNFEKLLASGTGLYLKKTTIMTLDTNLNNFYQEINIDSLKDKIDFKKESHKLSSKIPKIDILTFNNPCRSSILNTFNIWDKRLSLLRFCRIRLDLLLLNKGQQIPPHAHRGVLSGFILLEGEVTIRHYHAKEYKENGIVCKKTVDKTLTVGDYTTNNDNRDNIHWLNGVAEKSILFRFNMTGLESSVPNYNNLGGRLYIDPSGIFAIDELAPFINSEEVNALKYNDSE